LVAKMKRQHITTLMLIMWVIGLNGCTESSDIAVQTPTDPVVETSAAPEKPAEPEVVDENRFIRANDLLALGRSEAPHFVFDVRARASFDESHIKNSLSMPYGQFEQKDLDAVDGLAKNSQVITYCGCPHHLAGLAADQLISFGYDNVRVLYEGFWHWKDNNMPLARKGSQAVTELHFAGVLLKDQQPLAGQQVFIRNRRNQQLEATSSDEAGRFSTSFHVLGYQPEDKFDIQVADVGGPVVDTVSGIIHATNNLKISL
jgi:rhodanese-related sulfurtransferase